MGAGRQGAGRYVRRPDGNLQIDSEGISCDIFRYFDGGYRVHSGGHRSEELGSQTCGTRIARFDDIGRLR